MSVSRHEVYPHIGQQIRIHRERLRMTQAELADAVEILRTSVTNIEAGRQRLTIQGLYDIAEVLKINPKSLLPEAS